VRGCWSLRRLPRLGKQTDEVVKVMSGEQAWWTKLQWDRDDAVSLTAVVMRPGFPRCPRTSASASSSRPTSDGGIYIPLLKPVHI
jgi:hypothetical protein